MNGSKRFRLRSGEKSDRLVAGWVLGARTLETRWRRSTVLGSIFVWITIGGWTLGCLMKIGLALQVFFKSKFILLYFDWYSQEFLDIRVFDASGVFNENFKILILLLCHRNPSELNSFNFNKFISQDWYLAICHNYPKDLKF